LEEVHDYGNRVIMSYHLLLARKRLTPLVTTILDRWLGLDAAPIVNGQFEQFDFVEK